MKHFFETRIEQKSLKLPKALQLEIKRTIEKLPLLDETGVEWSREKYRGGYTSYGSISNLHEQFSVIDRLKSAIDREVSRYAKAIGIKPTRGELRLSTIWANIMPMHCYHAFHLHPNSVVSGTYYVNVPKGTSPLRIEDPRSAMFMASPSREIQKDLHAKAGEIILFESWLKHEVPPHEADEDRISISFNYDWM